MIPELPVIPPNFGSGGSGLTPNGSSGSPDLQEILEGHRASLILLDDAVSSSIHTMTDVYIDADTGDDDNPGTALLPLATLGEWARRAAKGKFTVDQTVHIPFDDYVGDLDLRIATTAGHQVRWEFAPLILRTSTFTSVTPWDYPGETEGRYVDTAIPTSWTASGLIDRLIHFEGPSSDAWSWVALQDGSVARSARTSPAIDIVEFNNVEPDAGTAYTVRQLATMTGTTRVSARCDDGVTPAFVVRYAHFAGQSGPGLYVEDGDPQFHACELSGVQSSICKRGFATFFACRFEAALAARESAGVTISGGLVLNALVASFGSSISIDYRTLGQEQSQLLALNAGLLEILFEDYGVAFFNSVATPVVLLRQGGNANFEGKVWGTGSGAGPAVRVEANAVLTYLTGQKPNVTGYTTDTRAGATNNAYAAVPYVDAAKLAAITTK